MAEYQVLEMRKHGKIFKYKKVLKEKVCKRCSRTFKSIWARALYCEGGCYMAGVVERAKVHNKTADGKSFIRKYRQGWTRAWRVLALRRLGNKCVRCGYCDIRSLHIDHVFSDGHIERTLRKSVNKKIAEAAIDLSRYQLLCANCNWIKRLEQEEGTGGKAHNAFMLRVMRGEFDEMIEKIMTGEIGITDLASF